MPAEAGLAAGTRFWMGRLMDAETIGAVISRVQAVESDVAGLRRVIDGEPLSVSDRQYLSRCFDLLGMELEAVRQYLGGLTAP